MTTATMLAVLGALISVSGMPEPLASISDRALLARGRFMFIDGQECAPAMYSYKPRTAYVRPCIIALHRLIGPARP